MSEQLKQQQLYDVSEANTKNLIWVDVYVSGTEGATGTYASRRMIKAQLITFLNSNLSVAWSTITSKPTTLAGYGITDAIDGSGTLNKLAKFTPDGNTIGNSQIIDDGSSIGINTNPDSGKKITILETRDNSIGLTVSNTGGGTSYTQGINGLATGSSSSVKIGTRGTASGSTDKNYGLYGESAGNTTGMSVGVYGLANLSGSSNIAGYLQATSSSAGVAYGSAIYAEGSTTYNYGSYNQASGTTTGKAIGTYGYAINSGVESIGGKFEASATGSGTAYGTQIIDGTQGTGKFLKSITSDGKTNWSTLAISDVTSLQTSLDTKSDKNLTLNRQTASYTLVATDNGKLVEMNVATANNVTINNSLFTAGNQIIVSQYGAGQVSFVAGSGVTIRSASGKLKLTGQYSMATIICISATEFYLAGDLTA